MESIGGCFVVSINYFSAHLLSAGKDVIDQSFDPGVPQIKSQEDILEWRRLRDQCF